MEATTILPIVAVLSLVTVEYGGWALLTFLSGRAGLAEWQKGFFRAGRMQASSCCSPSSACSICRAPNSPTA
jgi:hypothetical protein